MLVVGHPGHELRVSGWLMSARPIVQVLTDGSGSDGHSRIDSTTTVLAGAAARRGSIYGRMTDREIYGAILAGEHARFVAIADELAGELIRHDVQTVAGDAVEGFNPSHDVCRFVINAGVRLAAKRTGRPIACYSFPLDAAPDAAAGNGTPIRVQLDDAMLERKLQAAHGYEELRSEVANALERFGREPFRTECLWPVDLADPYGWDQSRIPLYESYGAERVKRGVYERVVTFRDHVKPLADALWGHSAATAG
jgi:hypothetical protein